MGYIAIIGPVCVLVGLVVGYLFAKKLKEEENKKLKNTAEDIISKAKKESEELIKDIQNHVKKTTAPYKYPRLIEFVDEIPETISGKIRRVEIREKDNSN